MKEKKYSFNLVDNEEFLQLIYVKDLGILDTFNCLTKVYIGKRNKNIKICLESCGLHVVHSLQKNDIKQGKGDSNLDVFERNG